MTLYQSITIIVKSMSRHISREHAEARKLHLKHPGPQQSRNSLPKAWLLSRTFLLHYIPYHLHLIYDIQTVRRSPRFTLQVLQFF